MKFMMNVLQTCILISLAVVVSATDEDRKVFIAYMGSLPEGEYSPSLHHYEILKNITNPRFASKSLIRSYQRSFNGFAAYLTQEEQKKLAGMDGVISVFPSQKLRLHTTRSWDFMGFPLTVERSPMSESDIIIGVIDSGIWPESESFSDEGLGPVPAERWKGECRGGKNFTCNNKIIGARTYGSIDSARDEDGHGTHVASTIAGNEVMNANFYGLAEGVARGGVPSARLAVYKACDRHSCYDTDMLMAFDDAIADGVDVISISMGPDYPREITSDPIAIGAFHAMKRGILTVQSAGNEGPNWYSVESLAPWILTVGASNIDRRIVDKVLLGDGTILEGTSINAFPSSTEELPLVYGKQVTKTCSETDARNCRPKCIESSLVEQKVVICDELNDIYTLQAVTKGKPLGCISPDNGNNYSVVRPLPLAALNANDINLVKTYHNSTTKPKVKIFKSEAIHNTDAPLVASFSSRGPGLFLSDMIKPDVTAPGVEILAAFSPIASPSQIPLPNIDNRSVKYNILSGTSMACPHVAAAAAFLKSFHRHWSPSAIKSALMTTAREIYPSENIEAEFAYGSGHIDPHKAKDPGLVYETFKEDYLNIWCNISQSVGSLATVNATCPANKLTLRELNYPSMAAQVEIQTAFELSFPRTVTNVGTANSRYVASTQGSSSLQISVDPKILQFKAVNEKKSFVVTVRGYGIFLPATIESASLLWTDDTHRVRSPIVVYTGNGTATTSTPPTSSDQGISTGTRLCKTFVTLFVSIVIGYCTYI